ncbi:hypothetical protein KAR48_20505 [bacterium]|nr:hypothetical protein [bacterium]
MFKLESDTYKNRLIITLEGEIDMVQTKKIFFDLVRMLTRMKPNFDIITDLRNYSSGDPNGGVILKRAIETAREHGVGRIIRVVGSSKNAILQFGKYTDKRKDYAVQYVATMEEAEAILKSTNTK